MENYSKIIELIPVKYRILALLILVTLPVVSFLGGKYLDTSDCREIIDENKELHNDFAEASKKIRELRLTMIRSDYEFAAIDENGDTDGDGVYDKRDYAQPPSKEELILEDLLTLTEKNK